MINKEEVSKIASKLEDCREYLDYVDLDDLENLDHDLYYLTQIAIDKIQIAVDVVYNLSDALSECEK